MAPADGSYRSVLRWNPACRCADRTPIPVRVIENTVTGAPQGPPPYRLVTSVLEPARAPADELAALYHERWEIETTFDELKTHLRGAQRVLRSKTRSSCGKKRGGCCSRTMPFARSCTRRRSAHSSKPAIPTHSPLPMRSASAAARSPMWRPSPLTPEPARRSSPNCAPRPSARVAAASSRAG